jgi:threonine/homoserine/homoserine lactone efflux protein
MSNRNSNPRPLSLIENLFPSSPCALRALCGEIAFSFAPLTNVNPSGSRPLLATHFLLVFVPSHFVPYTFFSMFDSHRFALFLAAALLLAITPGPGIFYVLARTLAGGRREGFQSSFGTFFGGLFHVFAAALGVSAILAASAVAFHTVKYAGAAYLIFLGIKMIRSRNVPLPDQAATQDSSPNANAFRPAAAAFKQGVLTEALNPKTALFFLSFIPQFIAPERGHIFLQFATLGILSVTLNTAADLLVVFCAAPLERKLKSSPTFRSRQRTASGLGMIGLGAYVALSDAK